MFLTRRSASGGGDRSPFGRFWFEPVGMRSITGMRVTSASAMRLSAVYSCVRVLAETFACLPFCLYEKRTDGRRGHGKLVTDHWLYRLFAKRPNRWQTPFEWTEMMMGHLVLRGNAFNQIVSDYKGEIVELIPLHPDRVKVELLPGNEYRFLIAQSDGTTLILARGEVWHLRGLSSDGILGLNPIELAADVLGLGMAAQSYGARFFANDTKPGGWVELPGKFADDSARQTWKESWKKAQSGANRGSTAVLEQGMKYHELSLNNSDAQFLESRKFSRSEIASIFRIPPHKIGDLEKATFSNIEQQSLEFVNDTMTPWAERWESSIETFLAFDDDELEIEYDFSNLLRGDSAARSTYYNKMFNLGALSPNDIRDREGEQSIEGGDQYFVPLNMVPLDQAGQAQDRSNAPVIAPDPEQQVAEQADPEQTDSTDARLVALLHGNAQRMARRVAAGNPPTAKVLAGALAICIDAADCWLSLSKAGFTEAELAASLVELGSKT